VRIQEPAATPPPRPRREIAGQARNDDFGAPVAPPPRPRREIADQVRNDGFGAPVAPPRPRREISYEEPVAPRPRREVSYEEPVAPPRPRREVTYEQPVAPPPRQPRFERAPEQPVAPPRPRREAAYEEPVVVEEYEDSGPRRGDYQSPAAVDSGPRRGDYQSPAAEDSGQFEEDAPVFEEDPLFEEPLFEEEPADEEPADEEPEEVYERPAMRQRRSFAPEAKPEPKPEPRPEPRREPVPIPVPVEDSEPRRGDYQSPASVGSGQTEDDFDDFEDEAPPARPSRRRQALTSTPPAPVSEERVGYDDGDAYYVEEEFEDEYEYEPTAPREKQRGGKLFWILLTVLVVFISVAGAIYGYYSISGRMEELPAWMQPSNWFGDKSEDLPAPTPNEEFEPTISDFVGDDGQEFKRVSVFLHPGDTVTLFLPHQEDYHKTNAEDELREILIDVPLSSYYPDEPLSSPVFSVSPELSVETLEGEVRNYTLDSFDLTFESVTITLTAPDLLAAEGGLEAGEGNVIAISGEVDDHLVEVYVNDEKFAVYEGGVFMGEYALTQEEGTELIVIRAEKANMVTAIIELEVMPFVYLPEPMVLTVEANPVSMRTAAGGKVTVKGKTLPGAQVTATSSLTDAACGSATVDETGNYSFVVTFNTKYLGFATITIQSVLEGHEEGEITCLAYNPPKDRGAFTAAFKGNYFELGKDATVESMKENPASTAGYRIEGTVRAVNQVGEYQVLTIEAKDESKATIYVLNLVKGWDATKRIGKSFRFYGQLNGFYPESEDQDLYFVAFLQL